MKQYIEILKDEKVIYDGRISDIPIKEEYIIKKSVELFDDDDPCIIHQSYVIKEYVDEVLHAFKCEESKEVSVSKYMETLQFLDFTELEKITIKLKG